MERRYIRTTHVFVITHDTDERNFDDPNAELARQQTAMSDPQTAIEEFETLLESWRANGDNPFLIGQHVVQVTTDREDVGSHEALPRRTPSEEVKEAAENAGFEYRGF